MFNFATKSTQYKSSKVLGGADVSDATSFRTLFCGRYTFLSVLSLLVSLHLSLSSTCFL